MRKIFDMHCHYYLFDMTIDEKKKIFKEQFENLEIEKFSFLSIPTHFDHLGHKEFDILSNLKALYLKKSFSPNGYAYAGLVHPNQYDNINDIQDDFLKQVQFYYEVGFDGIKMLEGYPTFIKYTKQNIDSPIYDKFYKFCEEHKFPITIHIANPNENWDISNADKYAIEQGRVYDNTYLSKDEITKQLFNVLEKFPKLCIAVAHFGFFSKEYENVCRFMEYENTYLDITPGGEQLINMSLDFPKWKQLFIKYQNRIIFGSDFYAFPKDENWEINYQRRTKFLRQMLETDQEYIYLDTPFKGVKLDNYLLDKIYMNNGVSLLGTPKIINIALLKEEIGSVSLLSLTNKEKIDLTIIKQCFSIKD